MARVHNHDIAKISSDFMQLRNFKHSIINSITTLVVLVFKAQPCDTGNIAVSSFPQHDIEAVDPRGRTALHLAVSLGHLESVRVLLRHGAEVTKENANNWTG